MQPSNPEQASRSQRLLAACRRGLNHDLINELVATRGLLQLLQQDEWHRLSSAGKEYVSMLNRVCQRTFALAGTLGNLSRLGEDPAVAEVVALPKLAEEVFSTVQPPAPHRGVWEAPNAYAPRELLRQALTAAIALLQQAYPSGVGFFKFHARPQGGAIEWIISASPPEGTLPKAAPPALRPPVSNPRLDRLDWVLLRELAEACGGSALWRAEGGEVELVLTLPKPLASAGQ